MTSSVHQLTLPFRPSRAAAAPDNVDSFLAEIGSMVGGTEASQQQEQFDTGGPWQQVWDNNHNAFYYWHSQTNEVTWTQPAEFGNPAPVEPVPVPVANERSTSALANNPQPGRRTPRPSLMTARTSEHALHHRLESPTRRRKQRKRMKRRALPSPSVQRGCER